MGRHRKWTDEQLVDAVKTSISVREVITMLGLRGAGGNYATIKRRVADLSLDTGHWLGQAHLRGKSHTWAKSRPLASILQAGSRFTSYHLKNRLLKEQVLKAICANCQLAQWLGRPIPLELDHIDGDRDNNQIGNLRVLCPNCHALTPTYRARNTRHPHIPPLQEIWKGIQEAGGIPQYARRIGMHRNNIYAWLRSERLKRLSKVEEGRAEYFIERRPGGEMVNAGRLNRPAARHVGSSPTPGTKQKAKPRGLAFRLHTARLIRAGSAPRASASTHRALPGAGRDP